MKTFLALILLVCIGAAFAEIDSSCDVAGLSSLASSSCSENCETQAECSNAVSLLLNEAERCGCDSECQQVMDQSRLISAKCEALEEEDDEDEDDDEDDEDLTDNLDVDELSKSKKKKKKKTKSKGKKKGNKKSKGKKKGNKRSNKMMKMLKKWKKKVKDCRAIVQARSGSKAACVSCCVKNIVLYAVSEQFDLASIPEDVRRQREQLYEDAMNQNVENKMLELVREGALHENTYEPNDDLSQLELHDDDEEDDLEDDEEEDDDDDDDDDDLEEEEEEEFTEDSEDLDSKKKKKKKKGKKGKGKNKGKKNKKMSKKMKKKAKKACKKQVGMVFSFDLSSTSEALTLEEAKQRLAVQSLDFEELEEPIEEDEEENEEEEDELVVDTESDLDELEKKKKVSKKKAKKAAKKCCPNRVSMSSFEHQYVKQF